MGGGWHRPLPRARGAGVRGAAGALGAGRDGSLLPATGARRVTRVGLNTCASVGVGTGSWGGGGGRSHRGAHGDTYVSAGGGAAAHGQPWVCGVGGSSSRPSAPGGCGAGGALAAKSWRRRAHPRASGCAGPHGSPPPPAMAPGVTNGAPFCVGVGWGGDVLRQGGVLGTIMSPGHMAHVRGPHPKCGCPVCSTCTVAWPGWVQRPPALGDRGPVPLPTRGKQAPALPPGPQGPLRLGHVGAGGWLQGCKVGMKVGMKVGNGAINGKAIRPFSSSPSSSSLRHLLSSSTSTSFLLSLSLLLLLSLLSKISPYFCLVKAFSFPFNPSMAARKGTQSISAAKAPKVAGTPSTAKSSRNRTKA